MKPNRVALKTEALIDQYEAFAREQVRTLTKWQDQQLNKTIDRLCSSGDDWEEFIAKVALARISHWVMEKANEI